MGQGRCRGGKACVPGLSGKVLGRTGKVPGRLEKRPGFARQRCLYLSFKGICTLCSKVPEPFRQRFLYLSHKSTCTFQVKVPVPFAQRYLYLMTANPGRTVEKSGVFFRSSGDFSNLSGMFFRSSGGMLLLKPLFLYKVGADAEKQRARRSQRGFQSGALPQTPRNLCGLCDSA